MLGGSLDFAMQVLSEALRCDREVARYELTDEQWARMERHLPARKCDAGRGGRPARNARQLLNGMLWILHTGAPWRDLPRRYGPWQTVYGRFNEWRRAGVVDALVEALQGELVLGRQIDRDLWCVDGTNVRAARCAAGARKKGARKQSRRTTHSATRAEASARRSTS